MARVSNIGNMAGEAGRAMDTAFDNALEAGKLGENSSKEDIKKVAVKMGIADADADKETPISLRLRAQQDLEDKKSFMEMISTIISKIGEIKERIIQNMAR